MTPAWKRTEDLVLGLPALLVAAPIIAAAAVATVAEDGLPILYTDERIGMGGKPFRMYKLRTMVKGAVGTGLGRLVSKDDRRVTRIGRFLRRWSLDELPQLWNVIRGDMSIVGPRPTYAEQTRRYSERHAGRLAVRPGLTGLAQIHGRNDLTWEERIEWDLSYVAHASPWLDLKILLRTPLVLLRGIGLYGRAGVTPDYIGDVETSGDDRLL